MAATTQRQMILHKYYVYDPGVTAGDELGGLRVRIDEDEKGNYVLAPYLTMQYWVDAGLVGDKPVSELSGEAKTMLAQITRGRSEDNDATPRRMPKYDRRMQSGAPALFNQPASVERKKARRARQKDKGNGKQPKKPEPKKPEPTRPQGILGTPAEQAVANYVYDPTLDVWPDLKNGHIVLSPVRIGMDRFTGKMLTGWDHVVQSMYLIFATRYHERVLRRWVGSYVPHLLGNNATESTIASFYWAIAMGIDLWEPNYRIQRVRVGTRADGSILTSPEELRTGHLTTAMEGVYRPRGHLGHDTPQVRRVAGLVSRGYNMWERKAGYVAGAPPLGIGTTPTIPPGSAL